MRRRLGCGASDELRLAVAQQAEQPAHLAERLLAGVLDDVERVARLVELVVEHAPAAARLQDDDADRVGDDVVQLARDPRALLGDGLVRAHVDGSASSTRSRSRGTGA